MIASAGTDREGNSYNVNADTAAGKVAAALRAYKAIFLTDVAGWLADPDDPGSLVSRATVGEVEARARRGRGRHAAEARGLRRGDRRRRPVRAHHRRPPAALPAAGAVHRRGHRHDGHARDAELAGAARRSRRGRRCRPMPRAPVEFVRGEGARLWDAEGKEYLDFFAGLSVHNAGHCHPRIVAAIREQAGTPGAASPTSTTRSPRCASCERLVESSLGGKAFLCNSGAEANECAIKLVRKHAHARGIERPEIVVLEGAFHGRTLGGARGDAEARPRGPVRAAAAGLRRRAARRPRRRCAPRSASAPRR